jgi:heme/copper-type cytochrome/quinol oxidase subunit 2
MKTIKTVIAASLTCAVMLLFIPSMALGCGSCYGAADSSATNGMNLAILSMLGITGSVLAAMTSFFLYLRKRARLTLADIDTHYPTNENGGIQ